MPKKSVTSRDIRKEVSRTFDLTIPMLDPNKLVEVENQYLLMRFGDTIEDSYLTLSVKKEMMFRFLKIIEKESDKDLDKLLRELTKAKVDDHDSVLVNNFRVVYDTYRGLEDKVKEISYIYLEEMGEGMLHFQSEDKNKARMEIHTFDDLNDYCYFVAGTVGLYITDLVYIKDGIKLKREQAESFGRYLQKINIIKDFYKDLNEGRLFWPTVLFEAVSPLDIIGDVVDPDLKEKRLEILGKMIDSADQERKQTFEYIISISEKITGYRKFCQVNAIMGAETLDKIRDNEAVFKEGSVKISHEQVKTIVSLSENGYYTNKWLKEKYCQK